MQLACMFPGQGSHSIGMLKSIYDADTSIAQTFDEAKAVLNIDYWSIAQFGPEDLLNDTVTTQVVMLIADVAMYRFLEKHGMPTPLMMAGHSLGEYAALVCGGGIEFTDAIRLVRRRAELMRDVVAHTDGAMAAIIGLDNAMVQDICAKISKAHSDQIIEPANYNAPGQVVIAGNRQLIEFSLSQFEQAGARMSKVLKVSVPCHCRLMEPAAHQFYEVLNNTPMMAPKIKLISNVDLSIYESVDTMKNLLAEQLYKPVRWTETLALLKKHQINTVMECGPGKVLSGLVKRTEPELKSSFCFEINQLPTWDTI